MLLWKPSLSLFRCKNYFRFTNLRHKKLIYLSYSNNCSVRQKNHYRIQMKCKHWFFNDRATAKWCFVVKIRFKATIDIVLKLWRCEKKEKHFGVWKDEKRSALSSSNHFPKRNMLLNIIKSSSYSFVIAAYTHMYTLTEPWSVAIRIIREII